MKFQVPSLDQYDPRIWNTAFVTGIEGIPWEGRTSTQGDNFWIDRPLDESGRLSILWPTEELGYCTVTTATLRCEEESPYALPLELARGTLHRVKARAFDWSRLGLKIPDSFNAMVQIATERFVDAIIALPGDQSSAAKLARQSISASLQAQRPLCRAFITQAIQFRQQQERQLSTLLAIQLDTSSDWKADAARSLGAMNTAIITPAWHLVQADSKSVPLTLIDEQMQWAVQEGLRIIAGPLVSLQPWTIQHWMHLLKDFDAICKAACEYVTKIVSRYRGQVSIWNVATGLNTPNDLGLSDEQHLKMAVEVIQAARAADPRTPVILTIDMPWGEYLGQSSQAINPLPFADALIRAQLGLSGLGLEVNSGFWPGGTLPKDLIDVSDLIDHWSMLGVPLVALVTGSLGSNLAVPRTASSPTNEQASKVTSTINKNSDIYGWQNPQSVDAVASIESNQRVSQASLMMETIQMLLAKQNVHAIGWTQMSDRDPLRFPGSGLFDGEGRPKPMLDGLVQLRSRYGQ